VLNTSLLETVSCSRLSSCVAWHEERMELGAVKFFFSCSIEISYMLRSLICSFVNTLLSKHVVGLLASSRVLSQRVAPMLHEFFVT